jgi:predicted DNA-binding antitoxin AbrB/MazE fold protein
MNSAYFIALLLFLGLHFIIGSKVCEVFKNTVKTLIIYKYGVFKSVRKLQGNDVKFKVRINEKGTRFSEKIKINEKENTVRFTVPKHNDIDESEILHEFNLVCDTQINAAYTYKQ